MSARWSEASASDSALGDGRAVALKRRCCAIAIRSESKPSYFAEDAEDAVAAAAEEACGDSDVARGPPPLLDATHCSMSKIDDVPKLC